MLKMRVKFVKYDLTKTKNRKRSDMLVDGKSEKAVRAQLEKIHKGEQVVAIHELVWDETQIREVVNKLRRARQLPSRHGEVLRRR